MHPSTPIDHQHLALGITRSAHNGIALLAIARGNRRRESVLSNQHRLLGEDARYRALR